MPTFFLDPRVWVVIALSLLFGLVGGGAIGYWRGDVAGTNAERVVWQAKEVARQTAQAAAVAKRVKENSAIQAAHDAQNLKDSQTHEQSDHAVVAERDRLRADVRRAGGLRIPAPSPACGVGPAPAGQARADGGPAEAAARTIALPDSIASNLLDLVAEADAVVEQARAEQKRLIEDDAEAAAAARAEAADTGGEQHETEN